MTESLLLDTHIALWLDQAHKLLRSSTIARIESCRRDGGVVFFSAVSVWEIAMLLNADRLQFTIPIDDWVDRFIGDSGVEMVLLDHRTASRAYNLHHLEHCDPADRFLIATAIGLDCPLVTYDSRILEFSRRHGQRDRFAAVAD